MRQYYVEPSLEEFSTRVDKIQQIVDHARQFTKEEFVKNIRQGDVIIPYLRTSQQSMMGKFFSGILKIAQGSSFTSCKMVGHNGEEIIGFGVSTKKSGITKAKIIPFLNTHEITLVLRHKQINDEKAQKIVDAMYQFKADKTEYDTIGLLKGLWQHFVHKDRTDKDAEEKFMSKSKMALICSTVVYKCYKMAGLEISHPNTVGMNYVWPSDVLVSDSFNVVGGYFAQESGVAKTPENTQNNEHKA